MTFALTLLVPCSSVPTIMVFPIPRLVPRFFFGMHVPFNSRRESIERLRPPWKRTNRSPRILCMNQAAVWRIPTADLATYLMLDISRRYVLIRRRVVESGNPFCSPTFEHSMTFPCLTEMCFRGEEGVVPVSIWHRLAAFLHSGARPPIGVGLPRISWRHAKGGIGGSSKWHGMNRSTASALRSIVRDNPFRMRASRGVKQGFCGMDPNRVNQVLAR